MHEEFLDRVLYSTMVPGMRDLYVHGNTVEWTNPQTGEHFTANLADIEEEQALLEVHAIH